MKILVATDGSECSTYAVKEFCRLFPNRSHLKIKVVSVYEEQYALAAETFSVPAEYYQHLTQQKVRLDILPRRRPRSSRVATVKWT